jgi:DNA-directed RNA polymerase specialized sigma24 family protein
MPSKKKYTEAEEQAQRQAVLAAVESGRTFQQAAKEAGVPVGRARWLYREGVRLQHSTEQASVSTDPLPEV